MNRIVCFAALAALASSGNALAVGGIAKVTIIDRNTGATLTPHYYHGEYWVAGTPGASYAIEIRNCVGGRLLAVTSVDGVNVISGATAGWDQAGYVFNPGERYQITGWRKTDAEVAAFTFTDSPNSYAERTGRPANVGVIGVAVFRERQPLRLYEAPRIGQTPPLPALPSMPVLPESRAADEAAPASDSASGSASASQSAAASESRSPAPLASLMRPAPALPSKLGTGHGEREYSYVDHTNFLRMKPEPNEVIRIRYDSLDNLVAMGILERPRPAAPGANPFPASPSQQYVPDPPG